MNRKIVLITGVVLILLSLSGFFLKDKIFPSQSGILIDTNPQSTVYIDNKQVGTTPYQVQQNAGEITVKLDPKQASFAPWTTKLTLTPGVETVVKRDFGSTEGESSGEVLAYEKTSQSSSSLTIVSSPDASQVTIDGEVRGFTPLPIENLIQGDHKIVVSQPGFLDREISAKTRGGYKLTVVATLARNKQEAQVLSETAEATNEAQVDDSLGKIVIAETPTGFLRVRATPSTSATEEGQVKPGESFSILEEDKSGSWYKIEYKIGKQGWIFGQYAKKSS